MAALDDNGFDDITMSFLTSETDSNGEYIYWHNVDPDLNKDGHTAHATPRSWAELMRSLRAEMKISGYKKISEIPEKRRELDKGLMNSICDKDITENDKWKRGIVYENFILRIWWKHKGRRYS